MTVSEYTEAENKVVTCTTFESSENWRQELQEMVVLNGHQSKRVDVEDEDKDTDKEPPASASPHTLEAIKLGNDILTFFQSRGEEELVDSMFRTIQQVQM